MIASSRYKEASHALNLKLTSDLENAKENLARKNDELLSRLRRLAQLPGAEKVFAEISSDIDLAWLSDGELQKWREAGEPAVRTYFSSTDERTLQNFRINGFDAR